MSDIYKTILETATPEGAVRLQQVSSPVKGFDGTYLVQRIIGSKVHEGWRYKSSMIASKKYYLLAKAFKNSAPTTSTPIDNLNNYLLYAADITQEQREKIMEISATILNK